jgi:hypothetical protein
VLITHVIGDATGPEAYFGEDLYDAYEQKQYASYQWVPSPPKKYWEVPPLRYEVQDTPCTSQADVETAIKTFLED